jgi:arsenate reductase
MAEFFPVVVHHNPACGTSRNTVAMIEAAGYVPTLIPYLETGWTRPQLLGLLAAMGARPREVMRDKGAPAEALGLLRPEVSDDAILDAMIEHPVLVNRPIVVTPLGVRLCRPSEAVFDLLARKPASFTKEDGEVVDLRR